MDKQANHNMEPRAPEEVSDLKKEIEKRLRIEYCPDPGDTWEWGYHINCPECGIEIYIGK